MVIRASEDMVGLGVSRVSACTVGRSVEGSGLVGLSQQDWVSV